MKIVSITTILALSVFRTNDCQQIIKKENNHNQQQQNQHNYNRDASNNLAPSSRSLSRSYSVLDNAHPKINPVSGEYCYDDLCSSIAPSDKVGLEAIRSLHRQLDDDENGAVDLSESDDFLREELKYESGSERRQKAFHRNDDMHISVKELWEAWVRSEVHNWTVEQTVEWLSVGVGLPQYAQTFIANNVNGAALPRLAVSNMQYLSNSLGIKDPIHKQKIALKAMDVVLFGPPKESNSYIKDVIMLTLLLGTLFGFWYAYRMNKRSHTTLRRMMKDMESLHNAEMALQDLQKELERARQEQECATTEKQYLEKKLLEQQGAENIDLKTSYSDLEVAQLKAENERLRNELQRAEGELEDKCWSPPSGLQQWLQLSHEIENKAYVKKKISAEKQLQSAREACEKLRKKRSSLVGAFVSTHGKSIDEVDRSIVEARTLLNEVTQELAERVSRWKKIENMCGFNIINNRGLAALEAELYKGSSNGRGFSLKSRMSSQDDLDEDNGIFSSSDRLAFDSTTAGADSSGSEKFEGDEDTIYTVDSSVDFAVGGGDFGDEIFTRSRKSSSLSHRDKFIAHSFSQEFPNEHEVPPQVKSSHSETSLESPVLPVIHPRHKRLTSHKGESHSSSSGIALEEEAYSTDSNSTAAEDISSSEKNLKKSKLRFPKFTRKSRHTPPLEKHT